MLPLANPTISRPVERVQPQLQPRRGAPVIDAMRAGPCYTAQGRRRLGKSRLMLDSPLKKG